MINGVSKEELSANATPEDCEEWLNANAAPDKSENGLCINVAPKGSKDGPQATAIPKVFTAAYSTIEACIMQALEKVTESPYKNF